MALPKCGASDNLRNLQNYIFNGVIMVWKIVVFLPHCSFLNMQTSDIYAYLNGMSASAYLLACLVCGLQLRFSIFNGNKPTKISRLVGSVLLCMSFCAVLYVLSYLVTRQEWLYKLAASIDLLLYSGLACGAYLLYSNRYPSKRKILVLALPYITIVAMYNCLSLSFCDRLPDLAVASLIIQYLHYCKAIRRHERELDDLYSDPDSHTLRWLWIVVGLYAGWWVLHTVFLIDNLRPWYDVALYTYMVAFVLITSSKICNYREPASLETQKVIGQIQNNGGNIMHDDLKPLQKALIQSMEDKCLYLNADLTVDDVVRHLGTNTKYFYIMLHDDMHTTFSQFVNSYRVERAKEMLQGTDSRISEVAESCGFNSTQVFYRVFVKMTGKSPSEWRKK